MAFLTSRDDDTEESLGRQLAQAREDLEDGKLSQTEYDKLVLQLEAKRAMLSVTPVIDVNVEARLKDLDYLHARNWISDEEYEAKRAEILGEAPAAPAYSFDISQSEDHSLNHVYDTPWLTREQQLLQLDTLHKAGFYTDEEYREEKRKIEGRD